MSIKDLPSHLHWLKPKAGTVFLVLFAIAFLWRSLSAPFVVDHDAWSNLLPIIHYQNSIINESSPPLYTSLWYGGWEQWKNPLWNFLYLPATSIWLLTPLDWGTKFVYLSHLLFSVFAAKKLSSLFFEGEFESTAAAILFTSPILPAFSVGHIEKILSWGWFLLAAYLIISQKRSPHIKGILAGLCLGIVPITGSNYYTLYALIVLTPLAIAELGYKHFKFFMLGSLIGLLHLPSVLHLVGQPRADASDWIPFFSLDLLGIFLSLSFGLINSNLPIWSETWAIIGLPAVYLFFKAFIQNTIESAKSKSMPPKSLVALSISTLLLIALATGTAYQGHSLLDTFRVPSRATPFIAFCVLIFTLTGLSPIPKNKLNTHKALIAISALYVMVFSIRIAPTPSIYGPYDPQAQELAQMLKKMGSEQAWISVPHEEMYIQVALNLYQIGLPNVYYGDMGQEVSVYGDYCGYSFDHLVTTDPPIDGYIELKSNMDWYKPIGKIPVENLLLLQTITINNKPYSIYQTTCK